jgi:hypothetical protein
MYRFDIINHLIKINDFKNYLEIGVFDGECIKQIVCENKDGVDPGAENGLAIGVNYKLTSNDFFANHSDKIYDLIFIDGLHHSTQVDLDLKNSLNQTKDSGIVILHDCNPPTEEMTLIPRQTIQWNGDVYKSVLKFRRDNKDHSYYTVDTDWGVGIIIKNVKQSTNVKVEEFDKALEDWNYFDINRNRLLNIITEDEFYNIFISKNRPTLKTTWNSGFFSCCTARLRNILEFHHNNKILPFVDSSEQWELYKDDGIENIQQWWGGTVEIYNNNDITNKFFKIHKDIKDFPSQSFSEFCDHPMVCNDDQYTNYHKINYNYVNKVIDLYFNLSDEIIQIKKDLIKKYKIEPQSLITICYRGNDKYLETNLPNYDEMLRKLEEIKNKKPNHSILVQSDEKEFNDFILKKFPKSIIIEETVKLSKTTNAVQYTINKGERTKNAQIFLSVMALISESSEVILNSGNVGLWICLLRKNSNNVHQYLSKINQNSEATWL